MRLPFDGTFIRTQRFNDPRYRANYAKFNLLGHNGEDYSCPVGTPIKAPHAGRVREVASDASGYGNYVKIESDEEGSVLAHLSKIVVGVDEFVQEGTLIGYSGNTGNSTGAHLHWGYYRTQTRNRENGFAGFIDQVDWLDLKTAQTPQFSFVYQNKIDISNPVKRDDFAKFMGFDNWQLYQENQEAPLKKAIKDYQGALDQAGDIKRQLDEVASEYRDYLNNHKCPEEIVIEKTTHTTKEPFFYNSLANFFYQIAKAIEDRSVGR